MNDAINKSASVIIYVLCYDDATYKSCMQRYARYSLWAKPVLMKYQNVTFENAFWQQLLEIEHEWESCAMVGTISHKAHMKMNIDVLDKMIHAQRYLLYDYFTFIENGATLFHDHTDHQIITKLLVRDMASKLNHTTDSKLCFCNYWMTTPSLMKSFIQWHLNICLPALLEHPKCFDKYIYTGGSLSNCQLMKLWGRPYYPATPFVLERINSIFFSNARIKKGTLKKVQNKLLMSMQIKN